ncbi:ABC transporter permease [Roseiterribacter gracilis]|uniref:ABC transporter permease n=1 Tax=Roseiterribacter gracilis TaxID=2812848 RepID=A0A8S8XCB0_9PROT|nr:ABC transporter permease [Rhodospirillales bacterium TMPK1]
MRSRALPIATALLLVLALWYVAAAALNWTQANGDLLGTMSLAKPLLPAPHQIAIEFWNSTAGQRIDSKRSLVFHAAVTASSTLVGFALGVAIGLLLAIVLVHVRVLDRALLPWIVASQTVPILAIAPMIVVVFGALGLTGLLPKAVIAAYLSFFPVVIGVAKGLRAPDQLQLDLLHTYDASRRRVLAVLRWPAAMRFLFPSLKVAIAASTVGAIVAELPTGAESGLGARLLAGSYYGQTLQIWAALAMASLLAASGVGVVVLCERLVIRARGGRL